MSQGVNDNTTVKEKVLTKYINYQEAEDRCTKYLTMLMSGDDLILFSNTENIDWLYICKTALEIAECLHINEDGELISNDKIINLISRMERL